VYQLAKAALPTLGLPKVQLYTLLETLWEISTLIMKDEEGENREMMN
jgi:hypothetical protein